MPAPVGEPIAPTGAVAAALVNVAQGFAIGRNPEPNGHPPRGSFDGLEDLGLDGRDVQAQLSLLKQDLDKQNKIVDGAEKMLDAVDRTDSRREAIRDQVEVALDDAKARIVVINKKIEQLREQSGSSRRGATLPNGAIMPSAATSRIPFWTNQTGPNGRPREEVADREDY
ncbi:hypothetical protein FRC09_013976, partial [Ceratobasidium sp. 395]